MLCLFDVVFNRADVCTSLIFNRLYKMSENVKVFYFFETTLMKQQHSLSTDDNRKLNASATFRFDITVLLVLYYRARNA